jgi:hypothetical protein
MEAGGACTQRLSIRAQTAMVWVSELARDCVDSLEALGDKHVGGVRGTPTSATATAL